VLSCPSGMTVSNRALLMLADLLRKNRPRSRPDGGGCTPAAKPCWSSRNYAGRDPPALPGSRHDVAAACEHGIFGALDAAQLSTLADTGFHGAGPTVRIPQRRRRVDHRRVVPL
jgi:hypothetical protein